MKWRARLFCGRGPLPGIWLRRPIEQSLREAARRSGLLIGTAVRPAQLSEAAYASTLAREFNMVEPEDALKWEVLRSGTADFRFFSSRPIVDFAARHEMKVRGHTLVWHRQNPKWLTEGKFTPASSLQILETHIKTVVGHYRGKIFAWDVVNEAFDELHPGNCAARSGATSPGSAWETAANTSRELEQSRSLAARSSQHGASYSYRALFPLGA